MEKLMRFTPLFAILFLIFSCNSPGSAAHDPLITDSVYGEKTACLLSQIAYSKTVAEDLDQHLPGWKVVWDGQPRGGNYTFIATNGTGYAISIRGSLLEFSWDAFQNWVYQDLNVTSLRDWPHTNDSSKARIAQGAWDGWQNLCNMTDKNTGISMLAFLESNTIIETPILVVGHSLGGNLATVYASYLWQHFRNNKKENNNINVITFAAPAAGNYYFAIDFNKKFPNSLRFENKNDLVPKFPTSLGVSSLGDLYDSLPSASAVVVGYKSSTVPLSRAFTMIGFALNVLEITAGGNYTQPCGEGKKFIFPLSGKNANNTIESWLSEAGYQHGMEQYARQLGTPVIGRNFQ